MKLLTIVVISLVTVLTLFALLNWSAVVAPAPLSIGFATVNAPLGLIMLAAAGVLTAAFLAFIVFQQGVALVEARRAARDLHAQQELAEKAEVSRFTDLRTYLESELRKIDERVDRLEGAIVGRLAQTENGLSAHVAEVEDKIDRVLQVKTS